MPFSLRRAREIVEAYLEIKGRDPTRPDKEIAAQLGLSLSALWQAKVLCRKHFPDLPLSDGRKSRSPDGGRIEPPRPSPDPQIRPNSTVCRTPPQRVITRVAARLSADTPGPGPGVFIEQMEGPTIAVADTHLNDVDCLYDSFRSALDHACEYLRRLGPWPRLNLLIAGDWVSGRGIFRGQEFRNLLADVNWQAAVGAEALYEVVRCLQDISGTVRVWYVKGNHDVDKSSAMEFGMWVVDLVQRFGVTAKYYPLDAVFNLATRDAPVNALVLHGFGYSMYRPQSPSFINAVTRRVMDLNAMQPPERQVMRVIHGHAHWLDPDFRLSQWGIAIDALGGWQRNTRLRLGRTSRPTGLLVYYYADGVLNLIPIEPDREILAKEVQSPRLVARNMLLVAKWLDAALERMGYEL